MEKMKRLVEIIKNLIIKEEDDKILNVRGGRGYSAGHPYPIKSEPLPVYGYVEGEEQIEADDEPVKISKAFKKE